MINSVLCSGDFQEDDCPEAIAWPLGVFFLIVHIAVSAVWQEQTSGFREEKVRQEEEGD